jgi:hypothetical protein
MNTKRTIAVCLLAFVVMGVSAQEAKYEIKSAIITKEVAAMGMKFESISYIDDFGQKECAEITIKNGIAPGVDKHIRTLMEGEAVVSIDLDLKQSTRVELPEKPVNYLQLTPEVREKNKIKEAGEEEVAGKKCKKYTLEMATPNGQTLYVSAWVWKGLMLKSETSGNGTLLATETATEIQENATVPAEKFTVPEGFTLPK